MAVCQSVGAVERRARRGMASSGLRRSTAMYVCLECYWCAALSCTSLHLSLGTVFSFSGVFNHQHFNRCGMVRSTRTSPCRISS